MRTGGQTTVIQRILEKRSHVPPQQVQEDTSATIAVMLRVLPPPRTLLAFGDAALRDQCENAITDNVLDTTAVDDEMDALRLHAAEFYHLIMTDSLELIRKIRARQKDRTAYILYVAELDEGQEREAGLIAGSDDCVGRRAPERELNARIGAGRRIAELEA